MIEMNPLLIADFYKATHYEQYPKKLTKMVSYLTPRMSRIEGWDFLIQVGLQAFCQEFLGESFKKNFFKKSRRKVLKDYKEFLDATLGVGAYDFRKSQTSINLDMFLLKSMDYPKVPKLMLRFL